MKKLIEDNEHSAKPRKSLIVIAKNLVIRWGWLILFVLGMLALVFFLRSMAQ